MVPTGKRRRSENLDPADEEAKTADAAEASDSAGVDDEATAEEKALRQEREEKRQALTSAFGAGEAGEAKLTTQRASKLDHLLGQAKCYSNFLVEQIADIENQFSTSNGKRKAPSQGGRAKRRKGAADPAADGPERELVPGLKGELREYQLKGIKWLIALYSNGLNGILADQMGLGKTVQTIGFLAHLRSIHSHGPYLVVGPLSTLSNWKAEFERWLPDMPCVLYHGSKAQREELRRSRMPTGPSKPGRPVVITSYEIVIADSKHLQKYPWRYVVVDEGHRLKNSNCRLLRELRMLPTGNKLLLTGTPLQNNLSELWSLLHYVLPEIFASLDAFQGWFDFDNLGDVSGREQVIAQEQRSKTVSKLHDVLRPFVLRRIKADVEHSLPSKQEVVLYAAQTEEQRKIDQQLRDNTLMDAMSEVAKDAGGAKKSVAKLNNVLMQMRKNANHPDLITSAFDNSIMFPSADDMVKQCGKMALLDRMLPLLRKKGHKILIFSQMTKLLDLLDAFLDERGYRTCRIDGSVAWQDRQEAINSFNEDPDVGVFLLSTRAGGLGINLTSADTVIIYDSDWNPHQDMQAMDRAHRIGQTKPVLVLRLATQFSVEGRLLARANSKLALERLVIKRGTTVMTGAEAQSSSLNAEELLELLRSDGDQDECQAGVVTNKMLDQLLDRSHLAARKPPPYSESGKGYYIVRQADAAGMLKSVE